MSAQPATNAQLIPEVPQYRVRLFLSVDLTGSTAFKHQQKSPLNWLKAFQNFYGTFPSILSKKYQQCGENAKLSAHEIENGEPKLWKTVGDEILFCCRINSIHHVSVCIEAFILSLNKFASSIQSFDLNTKGNAWVASFPIPNSSIMPLGRNSTEDPLSGSNELISEDLEKQADENPSKFDFLGKGIDSGFRISKNSSINKLTISPGLAIFLLTASQNQDTTQFSRKVRLVEMQCFKGVADNNPYPVLVIDVFQDRDYEKLISTQNKLLGMEYDQESKELQNFLLDFLRFYKIEIPCIKLHEHSSCDTPDFYNKYKTEWEDERENIHKKSNMEEQSISDIPESENKPENEEKLSNHINFAKDLVK